MQTPGDNDAETFRDAIQGLHNGDFSRLEPLFVGEGAVAKIVQWHQEGHFANEPKAVAEALTCASFLGRTNVAAYLLDNGVDPAGGDGTGLNAIHWAANRGQPEAVRLLLRHNAPLESKSMYGGNALDTAVWSAINEPRGDQFTVIDELLKAGARLHQEPCPTGHKLVDAILRRYLET